jgi:hypothetical protein
MEIHKNGNTVEVKKSYEITTIGAKLTYSTVYWNTHRVLLNEKR